MCEISVIIPVYNVERYLNRCVNSLLSQTISNFEIILVNDGSKDNSGLICDELGKEHPCIKVIHQKNAGLSGARNTGIDNSSGKYICFVDSDDYVSANYLELLYSNIISYDADLVVGGYEEIHKNSQDNKVYTRTHLICDNQEASKLLLENQNNGIYTVAWNKMYAKKLFNKNRYPLRKLHEDEFLSHVIMYESKKIIFIPDIIYYYVQNAASIIHNKSLKNYSDVLDAFNLRIDYYNNLGQVSLKKMAAYNLCDYIIYYNHINKIEFTREVKHLQKNYFKKSYAIMDKSKLNTKNNILFFIYFILSA